MHRCLYPASSSRPFFRGLFTSIFVGSFGAVSYHHYTIHADDHPKSDYEIYRDLVRTASSHHRPINPTLHRPPLNNGINYFANPDTGVVRYDTALDHRSPLWSSSDVRSITIGNGPTWTCFAIYQGIYGLDTCSFVHRYLVDDILSDVAQITFNYYPTDDNHAEVGSAIPSEESLKPLSETVDNVIRNNFIQMQEYIVDRGLEEILSSPSRSAATRPLCRAVSGCTCMMALYESDSALLKVVTTGNSRAVLGRRGQSKQKGWKYDAHEIPSPAAKATNGHGSSDYSNAFGLAVQRWNQDVLKRLHREYLCEPPVVGDHKFPGPTAAEPCLQTIEIQPGDFLVAGTDALWDAFTSEEVVNLVDIWLNHEHKSLKEHQSDAPPAVGSPGRHKISPDGRDHRWPGSDNQFQCADINAATHIIKNAWNQDRYFLTSGRQNMHGPHDTKRNGVGVLVIFFDDCKSPVHENLILLPSKADSSTNVDE